MPAASVQYFAPCRCGGQVPAELFQAGSVLTCPKCQNAVDVPTITVLKQLAGDKYPLLSVWQKIEKTLSSHESPFDGSCQRCGASPAALCVPIVFQAMHERSDAGQTRIALPGHVVTIQHYEEFWKRTIFPLLLCFHCHERFQWERKVSFWKRILVTIVLVGVCGGLAFWGLGTIGEKANPADQATTRSLQIAIRLFAGITIFSVLVWRQVDSKRRRVQRGNRSVIGWLNEIPLVRDLIAGEDECRVHVGQTVPWPLPPSSGD